ncbi:MULTISPECIES: hypothetical protein [unclassified Ruegeria]|uniref:hypothetical protein n=1 Tax=unclassified Ruegeria TaxID=2625375 RepID=UPI001488EF75|nr:MULTISPECIES: hypothetical protein [unclassified Ruegeria]
MVQNNKVLTVSYGTFSCTLEGFDDSFETMKAIAEYFRDLAADDRYFGSEPPQPDAAMLTRIAQREASRHVEARQSESGLLLRATESETGNAEGADIAPAAAAPTLPESSPVPTPAPAVDFQDEPPADSIAAKLQRIRAVVSHSDQTPAADAGGEDVDTGYIEPKKPQYDAISAAFASGALDPSDLEAETSDSAENEPAEDDDWPEADRQQRELDAVVAEYEAHRPKTVAPEVKAEPQPQEFAEELPTTPTKPGNLDADFDTEEEPADMEPVFDSSVIEEAAAMLARDTDAGQDDATDQAAVSADHVVESSEPLHMPEDSSERQTSATSHTPEQSDEEEDQRNVLDADDEADLLEEISLIEAEMAARPTPPEDAPEEDTRTEDVSRLMDTADERMEDPETSGQREAYSHLRTAVAATEAERQADPNANQGSPDEEYRGDLASVVSPRRPEVKVTSKRPNADAASPLKLVAEQRVDAAPERNEDETLAQHSSVSQPLAGEEEGGFATFAQEQGAQSLPDLLEAAAAYLSFIEGQEQFSRPQLMNKVRSLKQDSFDREESLRSFGQLLRDGKIEKAGGGRFAASTDIGFRPDDERAAG